MLISLVVWLTALLNAAAWLLSLAGMLNKTGYFFVAVGLVAIGIWKIRRSPLPQGLLRRESKKLFTRIRKPLPLAFFACALIALCQGLLFMPDHSDGLAYRIPRMLHWLHAEHWYWIDTADSRMNTRGCGSEFTALPFLLFTQSMKSVFVFNFLTYLCLPGLIFGTFRRLGVASRVAWYWTWILPTAYSLVLEAGNASSDLPAAVYALAALYFALRAVETRHCREITLSILCASLMTATKQTTIPLLLPWAIALFPCLREAWTHRGKMALVVLFALSISGATQVCLNYRYCGNWIGVESDLVRQFNPLIRILGNEIQLVYQNLAPPFLPVSGYLNRAYETWSHSPTGSLFEACFEPPFMAFFWRLYVDDAGVGPGIVLLLVFSACYSVFKRYPVRPSSFCQRAILGGTVAAFVASLVGNTSDQAARLFSAYYFYLIPFALTGLGQSALAVKKWWRVAALVAAWQSVFFLLFVFSRSPLMSPIGPRKTYLLLETQSQTLHSWLEQNIPPGTATVGVVRVWYQWESWMWEPIGSRQVACLPFNPDGPQYASIRYIAVQKELLDQNKTTLAQWLERNHCTLVSEKMLTDQGWYIAKRN